MKPPSKEEVIDYFIEKGYRSDVGAKAFDYYDAGDWKDSRGKAVKCWKQKMIGVWFKPENEAGHEKDNGHSTKLSRAKTSLRRNRDGNIQGAGAVDVGNASETTRQLTSRR